MTKDNKYILGAVRYYGIILLEINPIDFSLSLQNSIKNNGGEGIILSTDQNYAFIADGY
jgi:hypothetical protein